MKPAANTAETREPLVDLHHSAQAAGSASKLTKSSPIAESATAESPRDASAAPAQEATAAHSEIAAAQPDRLDPAALGTNTTSATGGTSDAAPARVATTTLSPRELPERFPSVVRLALDEGRREARIQLMPPDLGAIQVRLRVNGRSVHAQMTVEREEVRALVEGLRKELSDQMEKSGLKLERLDVATSLVATTFDPNVVSAPSSQAPTMQAQSNGRNGERAADGDSQSARRERGDGRMPEAMPPEKRAERRENSRGVDVRV
ncbi:MAG: flagellar hook-length control protein FliK [Candidatus Eisenbacteria bacterium]